MGLEASTLSAIGDLITAIVTCLIAYFAYRQLPLIAQQVKFLADQLDASTKAMDAARRAEIDSHHRIKAWETVKICQAYYFDPVIEAATERMWRMSNGGKEYIIDKIDNRDIRCLLNYLDHIAVGVRQDLYIKEIVKDHLGEIIKGHVENLLLSNIEDRKYYIELMNFYAELVARPAQAYKSAQGVASVSA
jgi:hypothetical protein